MIAPISFSRFYWCLSQPEIQTTLSSKILAKCLLAEQSLIIKESLPSFVTLKEYGYIPKGDTRSHLLIDVKLC